MANQNSSMSAARIAAELAAATVDEIPAVKKEQLEAQIEELNQHMEAISEKIKACEDSREELKMVGDYFRMRTKKYEVLGTLPQSERTFVLSGYVPAKASAVKPTTGSPAWLYGSTSDVREAPSSVSPVTSQPPAPSA